MHYIFRTIKQHLIICSITTMSISLWCSHKEEPLIKNDQIAWIQKLHREPIIDTDVIPFSFLDGYVGQLKDGSWFISNRVKFGLSVPNFQTTIMGLDMDIRVDIRSHSFNHIHAFHKRLCKPLQKGNAENLNQDQKVYIFSENSCHRSTKISMQTKSEKK